MKAFYLRAHGGNDQYAYSEDWPDPTPAADQVLVQIHACGLKLPFLQAVRWTFFFWTGSAGGDLFQDLFLDLFRIFSGLFFTSYFQFSASTKGMVLGFFSGLLFTSSFDSTASTKEMILGILQKVRKHTGSGPQSDDITMMTIRYLKNNNES